ncbi:MAG: hypothetical protein ACRDNK_24870 [Solirubrobacteraceae bacterium]
MPQQANRQDRGTRRLVVTILTIFTALVGVGLILFTSPSSNPRHHGAARTPAPSAGAPATARPFAANSAWNAPVPAGTPLSPNSGKYVSELGTQLRQAGAWINATQFSVPVYTVGPDTPRVPVTLDTSGGSADRLASDFRAGVPIPSGARAAAGTDAHLVIWQPSHNTLWEFWQARLVNGSWHARWGGKMPDVAQSPGYFTNPTDWGGTGTSLSLLGGLMRINELKAGHIDHALALSIPHAQAGHFVYPAQRSDGNDPNSGQIPEGTRFRLDPKLNIAAMKLPSMTKMIAIAAQRYGIIVRDQAGSVAFYAEDPTPTKTDPYGGPHGLFDGLSAAALLRVFPWSHLQVVSPSWNHH